MDIKAAIRPVSLDAAASNAAELTKLRHIVALAAGTAAGALRLESLYGFGFYFATCAATTLLLFLTVRTPSYFFTSPAKALTVEGVIPAFSGYVLAWCLVYSLVET